MNNSHINLPFSGDAELSTGRKIPAEPHRPLIVDLNYSPRGQQLEVGGLPKSLSGQQPLVATLPEMGEAVNQKLAVSLEAGEGC